MKQRIIFLRTVALLVALAAITCEPQVAAAKSPRPALLAVQIVRPPDPMIVFGKAYLVYELVLTSYDSVPVKILGVRAADPHDLRTQIKFEGDALAKMMNPIAAKNGAPDSTTLDSGETCLVYMWSSFESAEQVPKRLSHFIRYRVNHGMVVEDEIEVAPITISSAPPRSVGSPLRGGDWIADGGPSNDSYHRRARMVIDGTLYFAQRFAIDYEKIGPDGRTYAGDPKQNRSYMAYAAGLIAVADGKVVALHDGVPENVPDLVARAVKIDLETAAGNFVAIDIGYRRYALYGHMIPGSLTVKKGDFVKRGQVLGRLGNSGNSTEPHLHFQIADAPSFLGGNGLPYVYDQVDVKPSRIVNAKVDPPVVQVTGPARRFLATLFMQNDIVAFPK